MLVRSATSETRLPSVGLCCPTVGGYGEGSAVCWPIEEPPGVRAPR